MTITSAQEAPKQAAVEPVVEVPQEAKPAPQEDALAPKFAALAKKEKWIRKTMEDVSKEKESLKTKESEYATNYVPKKRIKEDFMTVMSEAGLTADEVANMLLNQPTGNDPRYKTLEAKIQALEEQLNQTKTGWETNEKKQYDQAIAQIQSEAKELLAKDDGAFETLRTRPDADELVTRYIEQTYKEDGQILKVEDAATFIENELFEQALAMAQLKKVHSKLGLSQAAQEQPLKQQAAQPQQQQLKTLTNTMTSSSKPLSSRDRRERAILAFQGKLS